MPSNANRQFLDFEKPIKDLIDEIEKLKHAQEHKKIDYTDAISKLETQILERRNDITQHLTSWQRVQLSRHPDRPYTLKYIQNMTTNFEELFGDRNVKDDKKGSIQKQDSSGILGWPIPKGTAKLCD